MEGKNSNKSGYEHDSLALEGLAESFPDIWDATCASGESKLISQKIERSCWNPT